ncbi:MAG: glycosyltransferase family 4 protein [Sphingomicrobium sp.]
MSGRRILALTTDSFGGRGGIATYARDAIRAMAALGDVAEVVVVVALKPDPAEPLPPKVTLVDKSGAGKSGYATAVVRLALAGGFDAVWIAHASLAPLGWLAARRSGVRLGMSLHGSEVWRRGRLSREWAMARADLVMPVSHLTLDRFRAARGGLDQPNAILPGAVDFAQFMPGPKPAALIERYGLAGRRVLLTVARIGADHGEKGFARVIAKLPRLIQRWPNLVYLIGGDGTERGQIEAQVAEAGLQQHVVITGYIDEAELADHYRLADAFILPSSGEGLGIVLLEAQACGIPTIASNLDGGAEAVAGMSRAVNPDDAVAVEEALDKAFAAPRVRPDGIGRFAIEAFNARMSDAIDRLLGT